MDLVKTRVRPAYSEAQLKLIPTDAPVECTACCAKALVPVPGAMHRASHPRDHVVNRPGKTPRAVNYGQVRTTHVCHPALGGCNRGYGPVG